MLTVHDIVKRGFKGYTIGWCLLWLYNCVWAGHGCMVGHGIIIRLVVQNPQTAALITFITKMFNCLFLLFSVKTYFIHPSLIFLHLPLEDTCHLAEVMLSSLIIMSNKEQIFYCDKLTWIHHAKYGASCQWFHFSAAAFCHSIITSNNHSPEFIQNVYRFMAMKVS